MHFLSRWIQKLNKTWTCFSDWLIKFRTWNNSPSSEIQKTTSKTVGFFFVSPSVLLYYLAVFCGEAQSCAVTLATVRWMEPCFAINHSLVNPWASECKVTSASRGSATQGSSRFGWFVWPSASLLTPQMMSCICGRLIGHAPCVLLHIAVNEAAAIQNNDVHEGLIKFLSMYLLVLSKISMYRLNQYDFSIVPIYQYSSPTHTQTLRALYLSIYLSSSTIRCIKVLYLIYVCIGIG